MIIKKYIFCKIVFNYLSINFFNIIIILRNFINIVYVYYVRIFLGVCYCVCLLVLYVYFFLKFYLFYYYDVCMLNFFNR